MTPVALGAAAICAAAALIAPILLAYVQPLGRAVRLYVGCSGLLLLSGLVLFSQDFTAKGASAGQPIGLFWFVAATAVWLGLSVVLGIRRRHQDEAIQS